MPDTTAATGAASANQPPPRDRSHARGRPHGTERRQLGNTCTIRVSPEEKARLQAAAEERGMGTSTLLRGLALSLLEGEPRLPHRRARRPLADPTLLRKLLGHVGKWGSNANQLAHQVNKAVKAGRHNATPKLEALQAQRKALERIECHLVRALKGGEVL